MSSALALSTSVIDPEALTRQDLVEVARDQQHQIVHMQHRNAIERPLPVVVRTGVSAASAFGTSALDAARGGSGEVKAAVGAAAIAASLALDESSPTVSKFLAEVGQGAVDALAADAGREFGLRKAAERERQRAADQAGAAAQGDGAARESAAAKRSAK